MSRPNRSAAKGSFLATLFASAIVMAGCTRGDGTVWDTHGKAASGCQVAAIQLRDEDGQVPRRPFRYLTTSSSSGRFTLPVLPAGEHLVVALRREPSAASSFALDEVLDQVAAGKLPESCLVGRDLLTSDGNAAWSGVRLQLGCPANEGTHVRGTLGGEFHPDEFTYEVAVSVRMPGVLPPDGPDFAYASVESDQTTKPKIEWTPVFSGTAASDGTFDLGWVPFADQDAVFYVGARPEPGVGLVNERVTLNGPDTVLVHDLPAVARVRVRVTGAVGYGFAEAPYVGYASQAESNGSGMAHGGRSRLPKTGTGGSHVVKDENGLQLLLREGTHVLHGYDDEHGLVSRLTRLEIAKGQLPDELVLPLEPFEPWTTRLTDKAGRSRWPGPIWIGAEGGSEEGPFPIALMVDPNGQATIRHLLPGVYPACVEGDKGPLRFDLDLTSRRAEMVVDVEF